MLSRRNKARLSYLWSALPPSSSAYWAFHWMRYQSTLLGAHLRGQYGTVHLIYAAIWCFFAGCAGFFCGFVFGFRDARDMYEASFNQNQILSIHDTFMRDNYAQLKAITRQRGYQCQDTLFNAYCYLTIPEKRPHFLIRIFYSIFALLVNTVDLIIFWPFKISYHLSKMTGESFTLNPLALGLFQIISALGGYIIGVLVYAMDGVPIM